MWRQGWLTVSGLACMAMLFMITMRVNVYDSGADIVRLDEATATPRLQTLPPTRAMPTPTPGSVSPLTPTATPYVINGLPVDALLVMPADVQAHIREIYQHGLEAGNNPRAFSKIGDSNSTLPFFLAAFDDADSYKLGDYTHLQSTIDNFAGSFERDSVAVRIGNHTWSILDSLWADPDRCEPNESQIDCEFRLHQPIIVLIQLGTNDAGRPELVEQNLRTIVTHCIDLGVIPVLTTKADEFEGEGGENNRLIRALATEFKIPLWEFERLVMTIPGKGLTEDGVHLTYGPSDYTQPVNLQRGRSLHNLSALIVLHHVWRTATIQN